MAEPEKPNRLPLLLLLPSLTSLGLTIVFFSPRTQALLDWLSNRLGQLVVAWVWLAPIGWLALTLYCSVTAARIIAARRGRTQPGDGAGTGFLLFIGQVFVGFAIFFVGCASNLKL